MAAQGDIVRAARTSIRELDLSGLHRPIQNTILRFTFWYAPASRVSLVNIGRVYEFMVTLPSDVRDSILAYTNNALSLKYRPAPTFMVFFRTSFGYIPWVAVSYVFLRRSFKRFENKDADGVCRACGLRKVGRRLMWVPVLYLRLHRSAAFFLLSGRETSALLDNRCVNEAAEICWPCSQFVCATPYHGHWTI